MRGPEGDPEKGPEGGPEWGPEEGSMFCLLPFPSNYISLDRGTVRVKSFAKKIIQGLLFGSDFVVFSCQKGDLNWCSALLMIQAFLW